MAHHVQECHWSVPTLLMPRPYWLSAWDAPWSCWKDGHVTLLSSTESCQSCPMWRARTVAQGAERAIPPEGAEPSGMDL